MGEPHPMVEDMAKRTATASGNAMKSAAMPTATAVAYQCPDCDNSTGETFSNSGVAMESGAARQDAMTHQSDSGHGTPNRMSRGIR